MEKMEEKKAMRVEGDLAETIPAEDETSETIEEKKNEPMIVESIFSTKHIIFL